MLLPEAFVVILLAVGVALLLSPIFGGKRIGNIDIPEIYGRSRYSSIAIGVFLILFALFSWLWEPRPQVEIRLPQEGSAKDNIELTLFNWSEGLVSLNPFIACRPIEGSWTRSQGPDIITHEPLAPTFHAVEQVQQLRKDASVTLRFGIRFNFTSDPITIPVSGRLACTYSIEVNPEQYETLQFEIAYFQEHDGFYFFLPDRWGEELTLSEFRSLIPAVRQGI